MTVEEMNELGLTEEEVREFFDEDVTYPITEIEEEKNEANVEADDDFEIDNDEPKDPKKLLFTTVKTAAMFLADELGLKITNTVDCIYKALKKENPVTHNYRVTKDHGFILLEPVQK